MIDIIYEDNHLLVVHKPANMPVQKDSSNDLDLLSYLKNYIKEKYNKPGNVYLGLVHRLDRPVEGIMVFAKTSKAAKRLSQQIKDHEMSKTYLAVIDGIVNKDGIFKDKLLKDSKTNTTKVDPNGKLAQLEYKVLETKNGLSLVKINLKTGRSHQIRVQFAYHNYPLYADQRYNKKAVKDQIALFSSELKFKHPITKQTLEFKLNMPKRYPFNLFINK